MPNLKKILNNGDYFLNVLCTYVKKYNDKAYYKLNNNI